MVAVTCYRAIAWKIFSIIINYVSGETLQQNFPIFGRDRLQETVIFRWLYATCYWGKVKRLINVHYGQSYFSC